MIVTFYPGAAKTPELEAVLWETLTGREHDRYTYRSAVMVDSQSGHEIGLAQQFAIDLHKGDKDVITFMCRTSDSRIYYVNFWEAPF